MAELPRFFLPGEDFGPAELSFSGDVLHHLRTVLRLAVDDEAVFLDGNGQCCRVRITRLDRKLGTAEVLQRWQTTETALPIHLVQALPKGDKFDLVLQKGTELGIRAFHPALTRRTVAQPDRQRSEQRQQRWQRIVQEAARQSRRSCLPQLTPLAPLESILETRTQGLRLVLWEAGARPLAEVLPSAPPSEVTVLIGPEGGFGPEEIEQIAARGFVPVHLGPRILRTETTGLAVTSILQYLYGDMHMTPND